VIIFKEAFVRPYWPATSKPPIGYCNTLGVPLGSQYTPCFKRCTASLPWPHQWPQLAGGGTCDALWKAPIIMAGSRAVA